MNGSTLQLVIGDWSGDGHMRTATFHLTSNMSVADTKAAYEAAKDIVPSHLHPSNICSEYEEYSVGGELYNEIVDFYFSDNEDWNESKVEDPSEEVFMETDWLAEITAAFVCKGNPSIEVSVVDDPPTLTFDQIGYGLFQ